VLVKESFQEFSQIASDEEIFLSSSEAFALAPGYGPEQKQQHSNGK
jgi:hypothetical protein